MEAASRYNCISAELAGVTSLADARTFAYKVPFSPKNTFFFVRPFADDLALATSIMKFSMMRGAEFLTPITIGAFAVNHIEFSGDETEAEAVVRRQHAIVADVPRPITPVIFLRYHKLAGQRSAEHLAIAKHDYSTQLISQIPRDGGTVELENYERIGMGFAGNQGDSALAVTFDGKTRKLPVADASKLMDALTFKGAEEAKKAW